MTFDWLEPHIGATARARWARAARRAYLRDLQARAALLRRLGFDPARAKARCMARMRWEFELSKCPPIEAAEAAQAIEDAWSGRHA